MDFRQFLESYEPGTLQKIASEVDNDFLEMLLPLLEKTANYAAYLAIEKLAEAEGVQMINPDAMPSTTPVTGNRENVDTVANPESKGVNLKQIHDAIYQAIEVGQADKIIPFVQSMSAKYPDTVGTIIQAVKVELHDGIMRKKIDDSSAIQIAQTLNSLIEA